MPRDLWNVNRNAKPPATTAHARRGGLACGEFQVERCVLTVGHGHRHRFTSEPLQECGFLPRLFVSTSKSIDHRNEIGGRRQRTQAVRAARRHVGRREEARPSEPSFGIRGERDDERVVRGRASGIGDRPSDFVRR